MKKITFILVAVLIASMSFGQKSLIDKKSKTNSLSSIKQFDQSTTSKTSAKSAKAVGTTIFSSDFSDPDQWEIHHGTGTSDDWVIGTTGPSNSIYMLPIESTTAANGFALFDSDNLCSGNQNAYLSSFSFDCSAYANVHIQFETFYKRYNEDGVFVQVSNDGTTWTDFEVFAEYVQQDQSTNPEIIDIDISSVAGNASPVWIRFKFLSQSSGCDFAWMIDDVLVYEYECELVSIPYLENFTGITTGELPECWDQNHTNWSVAESSDANGTSPELRFNWVPALDGQNIVYLPKMDATEKSNLTMSFLNYVNWYSGSFNILLAYTINNGATWSVAWQEMNITEDIDAEMTFVDLGFLDGEVFQLLFAFYGNTNDINTWSIDNISIYEKQTIPFTEDFTGVPNNTLPDGWNQRNAYSYVGPSASPELHVVSDPEISGENIVYLPTIDATTNSNLTMSFSHSVYYNTDVFDLRIDYTIDNGETWNTAWEQTNNTASIDPERIFIDLSAVEGEVFQLAFILNGYNDDLSWNIDNISISEPLAIPFMEDFTGVPANTLPNCWDKSHPNSYVTSSSIANGTSPELMVNHEPGMNGEIKVYLPKMDATTISNISMSFLHQMYYSLSPFDLRLDYTVDNGATWHIAWLKSNNTTNIDPETVFIDLSSYVGNEIFQLAFVLNGASFDDLQWYIDNISIYETQTIPFMENFTGVPNYTLPVCWNQKNTNSYVVEDSNAGGTIPELMVYCDPAITGENIVYLPTIDATTSSNITMTFLHSAYYNTYDFDLRIDYSIDNGETWNTAWEKANNTTDVDPEEILVNLSAVDGEVFQLAFVLNGYNDDLAWYIDNINIYEEIICDPLSIPFMEDFTGVTAENLPDCWDQSHTNWSVSETSDAGGSFPELKLNWNPEVTDDIKVYLPTIDATSNSNLAMSFLHYVDYYNNSNNSFDLRLDYTIDDGATWNTAWDIINVNSNITSEEVYIDLSSFVDGEVFKLAFVFSGYTYDIDYWYIDNISIFEKNTINEIDVDSDVNDVYVCVGDNEATALAALAPQMKINDTNGVEYIVDLTWTIASYDANTSDAYNATGTFALPTGVEQTTIPTPLEVTAIVTVNDPLVIIFDFETEYCLGSTPDALPTTSVNNITGTWSPATITTTALGETDYTFTPDAGECTDLPYLIISVTVVDIPVVTCPGNFTITENSIVTLSGGIPTGGIYSGTGVTGNSFDPSSLANGDYTITYTYPGTGCSNFCDFIITVNISSSINSNETAEISIYPNPNNGMFNISFGNVNGEVYYQIYDIKGSIIVNKNIHTNGDTIEEVSLNLISGVYFVRIITETQTLVQKLIIE